MKKFAIGLVVALAFLAFAGESKACPAGSFAMVNGQVQFVPVTVASTGFGLGFGAVDPFLFGQAGVGARRAFRGAPIRRAARGLARPVARAARRR